MTTKTEQAVALFRAGDMRGAFRLFKSFKMGLSKAEQRSIQIAYECLTGKGAFYKSLGIDTDQEIKLACDMVNNKFNN